MMRARETFALRILNSIHGWMEEEQFAQRWKKKALRYAPMKRWINTRESSEIEQQSAFSTDIRPFIPFRGDWNRERDKN